MTGGVGSWEATAEVYSACLLRHDGYHAAQATGKECQQCLKLSMHALLALSHLRV